MREKMDGLSMDIEAAEKEKLQALFPQCFEEGKLNIDRLLNLCGEYITGDFEKLVSSFQIPVTRKERLWTLGTGI